MTDEEIIEEIVGENYEFWVRAGKDDLLEAVKILRSCEVAPETITYVLSSVWHAGGAEYGG